MDAQYEKHELRCNVERAGRDLPNAVIAEVLDVIQDPESQNDVTVRARLLQTLKGSRSWRLGAEEKLEVDTSWCPEPGLKVRKGMKAVFLFHDRSQTNGNAPLDVAACGVYAASQENLANLRRGIDQDFLAGERTEGQPAWRD